jgi:hypothetical protein
MGAQYIAGFMGHLPLREVLGVHLQSNHYPPVSLEWVDGCMEAITLAENDDWEAAVDSAPEWAKEKQGGKIPVHLVVKVLHLEPFIGRGGVDVQA